MTTHELNVRQDDGHMLGTHWIVSSAREATRHYLQMLKIAVDGIERLPEPDRSYLIDTLPPRLLRDVLPAIAEGVRKIEGVE